MVRPDIQQMLGKTTAEIADMTLHDFATLSFERGVRWNVRMDGGDIPGLTVKGRIRMASVRRRTVLGSIVARLAVVVAVMASTLVGGFPQALADGVGESWIACDVLHSEHCLKFYDTFQGRPVHYLSVKLKFYPLDEAPCDGTFCHIPAMPFLKQVCDHPQSGEFSFDGKHFRFFEPDLVRYRMVAETYVWQWGKGGVATEDPPVCEIS